MNCVSCDIDCVYHLGLFVFFPRVFLSSRVTGACPVTTDLIMRVNVRTTQQQLTTTNMPQDLSKVVLNMSAFSECLTNMPTTEYLPFPSVCQPIPNIAVFTERVSR